MNGAPADAPQLLSNQEENKYIRAINQKNHEAPYYNLRNIIRLISNAGAERVYECVSKRAWSAAAAAYASDGWQSIDTAPNGIFVMISDGQYIATAAKVNVVRDLTAGDEWMDENGDGLTPPTHWRPNPAPPRIDNAPAVNQL